MDRILITAGLEPLAQRLSKLLQGQGYETLFAESGEIPNILLASPDYKCLPYAVAPTFAHELLRLCLDEEVDVILPLRLAEMQVLAESATLFWEYGIEVLAPSKTQIVQFGVLSNPQKHLPIQVLSKGKNILTGTLLSPLGDLNGPFLVPDNGEEAFLIGLV